MAAASDHWMFELDRETARHQMWILGQILIAHGRKGGHPDFLQKLGYLPAIALRGPPGYDFVQVALMLLAQLSGGEMRIAGQRGLTDRRA